MKKIFLLLLLPILFIGCEKKYTGIIDVNNNDYSVINVFVPLNVAFNQQDSSLTVSIQFNNNSQFQQVHFNLFASDGKRINSNPVVMYDNGDITNYGDSVAGDNIYSGKVLLSSVYPNGTYRVDFFVIELSSVSKNVAQHNFTFYNGQENFPPVISNLTAPDTLHLTDEIQLVRLAVKVWDPNGLNDIETVYFNTFLPNGNPSSGNPFLMYDDGNMTDNGDEIEGDGIYSRVIQLPPSTPPGIYRFEFEARDREGELSNKIIHNLHVIN